MASRTTTSARPRRAARKDAGGRRVDRRTRPARAERRDARAALLDAAAAVFEERGFGDASVDEVAAREGYSKGALYWHFQSKDDLFFALVDERLRAGTNEMVELLESAPAGRDMTVEANRRFAQLLAGQSRLLLVEYEYWARAVRDPRLRRRYAARQAELRQAIAGALATRAVTLGHPELTADADALAAMIVALTDGLARRKLADPGFAPDEMLGEAIGLIYRGLVARAEDARG